MAASEFELASANLGTVLHPIEKTIEELRRETRALDEEFHFAQCFYEIIRPMGEDRLLFEKVIRRADDHIFQLVHLASWQSLILSLVRIWDKQGDHRTLKVEAIGRKLMRPGVLDELARRRAAWHDGAGVSKWDAMQSVPEHLRPSVADALVVVERRFGEKNAQRLREDAKAVVDLINRYASGESRGRLEQFRRLRNERLAHRQLKPSMEYPSPAAMRQDVEAFYRDTMQALAILSDIVLDSGFNPVDAERQRRKAAVSFWNGYHEQ